MDVVGNNGDGLSAVFNAATSEAERPYSGLALLSYMATEDGWEVPSFNAGPTRGGGAHELAVQAAISTSLRGDPLRVGLRPPQNSERDELREAPLAKSLATTMSPLDIYLHYCHQYRRKPNSGIKAGLSSKAGDWDMEEWDLSGNFLGDLGLNPVLEVVRVCTALRVINLRDNGLKNTGVESLVHCLVGHPSVKEVDVSDNRITLGAGKVLQELARRNPRITCINAEGTRIDPAVLQRLQSQLDSNVALAKSRGESF